MKRHVERSQPAAQSPVEVFINKEEVRRRLQVSMRTIDQWMSKGLLPYYKVGSSVRFKWADIECHLEQRCRIVRRTCPKPRPATEVR